MKKSLVALAVAAALPAYAQAQTSVTLTGSVDGSLEWVSKEVTGSDSDVRVSSGRWSQSRVAVVGSEDLGGGLKGLFNIEHRFNVDDGSVHSTSNFWFGQAWVGLGGNFGTVRFGRQYTPIFYALQPSDTTGYSWYYNAADLAGVAVRFNNYASYESNSLGGFKLRLGYAAGEQAAVGGVVADTKVGDTFGASLNGAFGPVSIGLGYHGIDGGATGADADQYAVSLGGKFGAFGLGLGYAVTDVDAGPERTGIYASASMGLGAGTLYLIYKQEETENAAGATTADDQYATLTYSHGLSKRTFLYGSFGYRNNKTADVKPKQLALGIRHFF